MAERLKNLFFTPASMQAFAQAVKKTYPAFDLTKFTELVFDDTFEKKELKEKMHHTTFCLHQVLPKNYSQAVKILSRAAPAIKGFEAMSLPDYVEIYGKENWDLSLKALSHFTQFASAEFAVRPYLDKQPQKTLAYLLEWAEHKNPHVRRLASEGCRPRLPWAIQLTGFIKDPRPILPILEKLKNDESDSVRRSVANNLNDISKDHSELILDICSSWLGQTKQTDAVVKHACRTLLKAGNKRALMLFGFGDPADLSVEELKLEKESICIGEIAPFTFTLHSKANRNNQVRLEYAVYYLKASGKYSKKVFQISERSCSPGKQIYKRRQSFINMSTRKHYPGKHQISIIVNGVEKAKTEIELKKAKI